MRILNIIPIISDIWTDEMQKYVTQDLLHTTEVVPRNIKYGPGSIEGEYDEALAIPEVLFMAKAAERDGFDAVFINCFGEPGVRAARELVKIPVFGGFEPAIFYSLGIADRIGIVSVLREVAPLIREVVDRENLRERIPSIRYVDIPVLDLDDIDKLVAALVKESIKAIEEDHVESIVLGCTAMAGVKERVEAGLKTGGYEVVIIEAAQAALIMLETYVRMGLKHSIYTYPAPREKKRTWRGGESIVDIV